MGAALRTAAPICAWGMCRRRAALYEFFIKRWNHLMDRRMRPGGTAAGNVDNPFLAAPRTLRRFTPPS